MTAPKVAILIESDFYEHEIWYYHYRFLEAGVDAQFVTRLWGNAAITFKGHEYHAPFECSGDLETLDLDSLAALIVPSPPNSRLTPAEATAMSISVRGMKRR